MPCVYLPGPAPAVTVANSYELKIFVNFGSLWGVPGGGGEAQGESVYLGDGAKQGCRKARGGGVSSTVYNYDVFHPLILLVIVSAVFIYSSVQYSKKITCEAINGKNSLR
jgi:hypothetical protein